MTTKQENAISMIKNQYENVATALYLVTNHLKDSEPLKHKVRQISHDILEHMIHLSDMSYVHVETHTLHLQSLLRIASAAGLIAEQNASILNGALQKTLKDMQQYMKTLTNMSISLSDLLYIEEPAADHPEDRNEPTGDSVSGAHSVVPRQVDQRVDRQVGASAASVPQRNTRPEASLQAAAPKMAFDGVASMHRAFDVINNKEKGIGSAAQQAQGQSGQSGGPGNAASGGRLSDRQQTIIRELRNKGQLTVKDLAEKIKGCSEKTIQRELLSLVGAGVLKKEGERRWSRYSVQ